MKMHFVNHLCLLKRVTAPGQIFVELRFLRLSFMILCYYNAHIVTCYANTILAILMAYPSLHNVLVFVLECCDKPKGKL